jgi:hypothetical protein
MNIIKSLKKDNRGFGHIELVVVVLVIAAVAASGFFVYQHQKKHVIAHAGSWTPVGTINLGNPRITYTGYACKQAIITNTQPPSWKIKGLVTASGSVIVANGDENLVNLWANSSSTWSSFTTITAKSTTSKFGSSTSVYNHVIIPQSAKGYIEFWLFSPGGYNNAFPLTIPNFSVANLTNC